MRVEYGEGDPEIYSLSLSVATGAKAEAMLHDRPDAILARLQGPGFEGEAMLFGATIDRDFCDALLRAIVRRRRLRGELGELVGSHTRAFRKAWTSTTSKLEPAAQPSESASP